MILGYNNSRKSPFGEIVSAFIGREKELSLLNALREKQSSSLVVIRGRRRVGKSRLVEEFGQQAGMKVYTFLGLPPEFDDDAISAHIAEKYQLAEFSKDMQRYFHQTKTYEDWSDAFYDLANYTSQGKILILLDG